jgi:two-component system LytT family response regulator
VTAHAAIVKPIRTLIVDDEAPARRGLALRLAKHPQIEVVAEAGNGEEALRKIAEFQPNLMFLDVQMPGLDGFGVLAALPLAQMPLTVFVTAYDQHAVRAFEAHALDYLLKPIERSRLDDALTRVQATLAARAAAEHSAKLLQLLGSVSGQPGLTLEQALTQDANALSGRHARLSIRDGERTRLIAQADITWIDAAGDYMCVHAAGNTHVMRATLGELERRLDPKCFRRIHRSTIVNLTHIEEIRTHPNGEAAVILRGGQQLKLSRSYRDSLAPLR